MKTEQIITKALEDLKISFDLSLSEETIKDWKEGIFNRFYKDGMSKYTYERSNYINNNLFDYLTIFYKENNTNREQQIEVFKTIYQTSYKESMFKKDKVLLPNDFFDIDYLEEKCFENDMHLIAFVLNQSSEKEKLYKILRENLFYKMLRSSYLLRLLKITNEIKKDDLDIYNYVFDDLCMNNKYWYDIESFIQNDCTVLTESNILSLVKHLNEYGIEGSCGINKYNKANRIYEIVSNRKIKFISTDGYSIPVNVELLKSISNDETGSSNIKKILEATSIEKKNKIKEKKV